MSQLKKQNISAKRKKEDEILNRILIWFGCSLVLEMVLFTIKHWFSIFFISALTVVVPIVAVLAMIYYLYQREFFYISILSVISIFGLWLFRYMNCNSFSYCIIFPTIALIVTVIAAVFFIFLQKSEGILHIQGQEIKLLRAKASYLGIYLTCAVSALALLCAIVLGVTIAYYFMFAMVAWVFIIAVYFTVKMM